MHSTLPNAEVIRPSSGKTRPRNAYGARRLQPERGDHPVGSELTYPGSGKVGDAHVPADEPCLSAEPVEKPKHCLRVDRGLAR